MGIRIEDDDLDRVAPFGVLCAADLTVLRSGPSWARLGDGFVGRDLLDVFEVLRPAGATTAAELRGHRESLLLLQMREGGARLRCQVVDVVDPDGVLLVGTPLLTSAEELEALGLSASDFSPIDQTPDVLSLRKGQERSLADLHSLNAELEETAAELRSSNRALSRAERRYRRIVELQPMVMYIDHVGPTPTADFVSPRVVEWFGFPVERWTHEPGFFFDLLHPGDRERIWQSHLRAERAGAPFDEEFRIVTADGRTLWMRGVDSVVVDDDDPGSARRVGFMLDITVAKKAELELRDTMSRLTTLIAHMQAGVLVEDAHRRVVTANDVLFGLFRSSSQPADVVGLPATAAVSQLVSAADDPTAFLRRTEELLAARWPALAETMTLSDSRVLEFDFQPIVSDGQDLGALWTFRDVTHRVQYEAALARARDEAIAASDAKTQFLASMSHEIRTPMHGVLATIELLQTTSLDSEQRDLVDVVRSSASALVQIINDILDLQKVEAGRIELVHESFSPAEVLRGVADILGPQARAKGLDLTVYADPDLPGEVVGDAMRLRQVVMNLAGNAVKFTHAGSVAISARLVGRRSGEATVEIEVRDTGRGIPPEKLATIFDPFVQARSGQEGTGLGLAIAERLVALMDGEITVSSVVGEGTTFVARVRVAEPAAGEAPVRVPEPEPGPRGIVLVVDGSLANQSLVMRQLARLGVAGRAVSGVAEAVEALDHAVPYAVVLVAVDLPDGDGYEFVRGLRSGGSGRAARVPVVGMVAGRDDQTSARCRDSGMVAALSKPVDLGELRSVLDRLLGGPAGTASPAARVP